jgi:uncharacterized protein YndB with AHSA1/START domain
MLLKILLGIAALVAVLAAYVALQPSRFEVKRSITITAPPAAVFPHVNDFHNWDAWSPWAKLDPAAKTSFEGPPSGVDAAFLWSGNKEIGEGRMTIVESKPNELVRIKLDFVKPFAGTSTAEFTFTPDVDNTVVTWSMSGNNNFLAKGFSLFVDCDKMMGGYFEKGLAQLKAVTEAGMPPTP